MAVYSDVVLQQVFVGKWQQAIAHKRVASALRCYPATGAIWAANDEMALGAFEATVEAEKVPGKNIFFGGINWKKEALQRVAEGTMTVSVGGHFMMGAWALVVLYDYHHGKYFVDEGLQIRQTIFGKEDWQKIDFTLFSKVLNPSLTGYDFSVEAVVRNKGLHKAHAPFRRNVNHPKKKKNHK